MLVCHCHAVTDCRIREEIEAGAADVSGIAEACGAGGGCGGCVPMIAQLLAGRASGTGPPGCPFLDAARAPSGASRDMEPVRLSA